TAVEWLRGVPEGRRARSCVGPLRADIDDAAVAHTLEFFLSGGQHGEPRYAFPRANFAWDRPECCAIFGIKGSAPPDHELLSGASSTRATSSPGPGIVLALAHLGLRPCRRRSIRANCRSRSKTLGWSHENRSIVIDSWR